MTLKEKLEVQGKKTYDFLVNPKVVRLSIKGALILFIPSLIIGAIIASLLDPAGIWMASAIWNQVGMPELPADEAGYSIFTDYISNLGSLNYSPIPFFLDDAAMITSLLLIPVSFYLKKRFCTIYDQQETPGKLGKNLSNFALIFMLLGMIGFFGIGFFSEDVADSLEYASNGLLMVGILDLHEFFSMVVFLNLIIAGIFLGLIGLKYTSMIPKVFDLNVSKSVIIIISIEMLIFPFPMMVATVITRWPFFEWMMLFAVFGWIVPLGVAFLKQINKELGLK
jgi:hypothetical protein